jgi:hypothetical protein
MKPSRPGHQPRAWDLPHRPLEPWGKGVGSVVEWRGGERHRHAALVRRIEAEEAKRWGTDGYFQKDLRRTREKGGGGGLGLNPTVAPHISRARHCLTGLGRRARPDGPWQAMGPPCRAKLGWATMSWIGPISGQSQEGMGRFSFIVIQ